MKDKKLLKFIIFSLICFTLAFAFVYGENIYRNLQKGEFQKYVVDNKTTLYLFFNEEKESAEGFHRLVAEIKYNFNEKISIRIIPNVEAHEMYRNDFRIDTMPRLIIVNSRGYVIANYRELIPFSRVERLLSPLS